VAAAVRPRVGIGAADLAGGDQADLGQLGHAAHEQQRRQHDADRDRDHHVEDDGQAEASQQHQRVAARGDAGDVPEVLHLGEVPGDQQQQAAIAAMGR
jgi:hypothetical protein